jgi:hypothetical protein
MGVVERFLDRIYGMNRKKVAAIEGKNPLAQYFKIRSRNCFTAG